MTGLDRYFLEPVNALTHLVGAIASLIGTVPLLYLTRDQPGKLASLLVYGLSMVALYTASTLLHGVRTSPARHRWLNRLDHAAIFLVIAGTYTPIVYNLFTGSWRWGVLVVIWLVVVVGMIYKLVSPRIHGVFNASIYVILGWGSAVPLFFASNLVDLAPLPGLLLLLFGGLIYTTGFLIYYFRRPDPWPGRLGHHEIWHLFVMAGSLCHYLFILFFIVL